MFANSILTMSPSHRIEALPDTFYHGSTVAIAKRLLGVYLVANSATGTTAGRIVETEAYLSKNDPACHAAHGETKRNRAMFGAPGTAYIYLIYGMYHCFNVVTRPAGCGEAVLIRALEPVSGIELMQKRRKKEKLTDLCSGPGKLVQAQGIAIALNGTSLDGPKLYLTRTLNGLPTGKRRPGEKIVTSTRIGIRTGADLPLRFYIGSSPFISRSISRA